MFPRDAGVRIVRQRVLGMTTVLTAITGEAAFGAIDTVAS
jgi:hypothetical protein